MVEKKGWSSKIDYKTKSKTPEISKEELAEKIAEFKKKGGKITKVKSFVD